MNSVICKHVFGDTKLPLDEDVLLIIAEYVLDKDTIEVLKGLYKLNQTLPNIERYYLSDHFLRSHDKLNFDSSIHYIIPYNDISRIVVVKKLVNFCYKKTKSAKFEYTCRAKHGLESTLIYGFCRQGKRAHLFSEEERKQMNYDYVARNHTCIAFLLNDFEYKVKPSIDPELYFLFKASEVSNRMSIDKFNERQIEQGLTSYYAKYKIQKQWRTAAEVKAILTGVLP